MSIRNDLSPRPPMGWNSYDTFGDFVTEAEVKAQADAMARLLLPAGWNYLVIDCGWYLPRFPDRPSTYENDIVLDEWGRLVPVVERFPSSAGGAGLRPLADYVHGLGLKFGLHVMRGIPRIAAACNLPILGSEQRAGDVADRQSFCPWSTGMWGMGWSQPGAQAYYDSIFALYAQWQVDFVKMDDMVGYAKPSEAPGKPGQGLGRVSLAPYYKDDVSGARAAANATGRDMVLSLSPGDFASAEFAPHMKQHVEMARLSADLWDEWPPLKRQFDLCPPWAGHIGNGFWPDIDMLPLGMIGLRHGSQRGPDRKTRFTDDEQQLMMTLWAIFRSPLFFGGDLTRLDEATLALLTHPEVLAVNQHSTANRQLFRRGEHAGWTADSPGGKEKYLAVFNLADDGPAEIAVGLDELGMAGQVRLRDLWRRQNLPPASAIRLAVPAHGSRLVKVSN